MIQFDNKLELSLYFDRWKKAQVTDLILSFKLPAFKGGTFIMGGKDLGVVNPWLSSLHCICCSVCSFSHPDLHSVSPPTKRRDLRVLSFRTSLKRSSALRILLFLYLWISSFQCRQHPSWGAFAAGTGEIVDVRCCCFEIIHRAMFGCGGNRCCKRKQIEPIMMSGSLGTGGVGWTREGLKITAQYLSTLVF